MAVQVFGEIENLLLSARDDGVVAFVAGAVVHRGGELLVVRRSLDDNFLPGREELPSGHVNEGESLLNGLRRELSEEIGWGLDAEPEPGFVSIFDYESTSGRLTRQFTWSVRFAGEEVRLSDEHDQCRWMAPERVEASDMTSESRQVVRQWMAWKRDDDRRTYVVASVAILRKGQLLTVRKRGTSHWQLPGGKIDSGEAPAAAAARELFEETGLEIVSSTLKALGVFQDVAAGDPEAHVRTHV